MLSLSCPTSTHLYNLSYLASFLTMWTLRISVFYNLVLFVTRTINIVSPFYHVNRRLILWFLVLIPWLPWFPVLVHQMMWKYSDGDIFKMRIITSSYLVGESLIHEVLRMGHYPVLLFCVFIPFVFPSVISIISLFPQAKCLMLASTCNSGRDPAKIRAGITIFLLTLVFFVCNTSSFSFWLNVCLNPDDAYLSSENAIWIYVTGVTIPFLNSAISPTILICRGNSLRNMVWNLFGRQEPKSQMSHPPRYTTKVSVAV